jgi:hypothetical protein
LEASPSRGRAYGDALQASKRFARTIRRRWICYHRQSRIDNDALCEPEVREAKLLGQRPMASGFDHRAAKFEDHHGVLNGFAALCMIVG